MNKVNLRFDYFTGGWIGRCQFCNSILASGTDDCPKPLWSTCDCKEAKINRQQEANPCAR